MMKKVLIAIFAITGIVLLTSAAAAQGPAGDWTSTIACQNLDAANPAEITLTFYAQGSSTASATYSASIPAGGSQNYAVADGNLGVPEDFLGSVVVTSSRSVVCTVNSETTGTGTSADPYRIASSSGLGENEIASAMYAPQVMKNYYGWNSYFSVQNAAGHEITIEVTYKDKTGNDLPTATETMTIAGYSNVVIYQDQNANLPDQFVGAAKVRVSNPAEAQIGMVINFYNSGTDAGTSQFHSYNGLSGGATKLYAPRVVRRFYGYNSGITIQNVSDTATSITIDFNFGGEAYSYQSAEISPSAALVLYMPDIAPTNAVDAFPVSQRFGNAVIQANNPAASIVAIINEDNRGNPADNDGNPVPAERIGQGSTYSAIPAGSETKTVYFPQVPRNVDGVFSGGFFISNISDADGICEIHFTGVPEAKIDDFSMPAHSSRSYYAPDIANLPDGFNASVRVACTIDVIGIQNFAAAPGSGKSGDSFTQNNGFNK